MLGEVVKIHLILGMGKTLPSTIRRGEEYTRDCGLSTKKHNME